MLGGPARGGAGAIEQMPMCAIRAAAFRRLRDMPHLARLRMCDLAP